MITKQVFGDDESVPPQVDHSSQKANGMRGEVGDNISG